MTNWLIHRLLTAKRQISDIPAILCRMIKWKWLLRGGILLPIYMVMFWQSGSYYWLYVWHGVIFLSQIAEKGYMFLLGLFFFKWQYLRTGACVESKICSLCTFLTLHKCLWPTWCPWSEALRNMTVGTAYSIERTEVNIIDFNLIFSIPFFLVYFTVTGNNHSL